MRQGASSMNDADATVPEMNRGDDDERSVLVAVRSLLDQLRLDAGHQLTLDSDLSNDLGVDSLALVELCDLLERSFDVTLPDEVFLSAATPREWLTSIRIAKGSEGPSATFPSEQRDGDSDVHTRATPGPLKRLAPRAPWRTRRRVTSGTKKVRPDRYGLRVVEWMYLIYSWLLIAPFALTIWMLAVLPISLQSRRIVGRLLARGLCRAVGISLSLEGSLPTSGGPFIVAANHASFVDGLVLYVLVPEPLVFVSSVEIERQPFLGRIAKSYGCLFVERGRAERSAASVEKLVSAVHEGKRLAIFPEGSISTGGGIRVFHLGAFEAATSANCPVVPIGIQGTRDILRAGSFRPHRGAVRVVIGSPLAPTGTEFSARVSLRDEVRTAISVISGESTIGSA